MIGIQLVTPSIYFPQNKINWKSFELAARNISNILLGGSNFKSMVELQIRKLDIFSKTIPSNEHRCIPMYVDTVPINSLAVAETGRELEFLGKCFRKKFAENDNIFHIFSQNRTGKNRDV